MKKNNVLIILLSVVSFGLGLSFSMKTWGGKKTARLYVQGRLVANTKGPVKKPLLVNENSIKVENIIASLAVAENEALGVIGLYFGNYVSEYGQSLCSAFDTVEVILFGDGIAVSGQPPRMILTGACSKENNSDIDSLRTQLKTIFPIFLVSDCQNNTAMNEYYELENGTEVKITNMDGGIADADWIIEKISFFDHNNPVHGIEFDFAEIKKIRKNSGFNINDGKIYIPCEG